MNRKIAKIQEVVHMRYLDFRSINYQLDSIRLEELFEKLTEHERIEVEKAATEGTLNKFNEITQSLTHKYSDLESKNVGQLRKMAQTLKIPNYTNIPKPVLYNLIKKETDKCQKQKQSNS